MPLHIIYIYKNASNRIANIVLCHWYSFFSSEMICEFDQIIARCRKPIYAEYEPSRKQL